MNRDTGNMERETGSRIGECMQALRNRQRVLANREME